MRIAAISDVHGNLHALRAVWAEMEQAAPDAVVSCGDLSWGPLPHETIAFIRSRDADVRFVRGNADRAVFELADGTAEVSRERDPWMVERHSAEDVAFLRTFEQTVTLDGVCFCHGSPQHDEDIITPITPGPRLGRLLEGLDERTVVSGHIHVQFDREVDGVRSINPGSVGLPYEDLPGAYWALFDDGEPTMRRTVYDLAETAALYRTTSDPLREEMVEILESPPKQDIERAERLERSG